MCNVLLPQMIHPAYNLFLAIYLARLLTDLVFQTSRIISINITENGAVIVHGITHYVAVLAIITRSPTHTDPDSIFQLLVVPLTSSSTRRLGKVSLTKSSDTRQRACLRS
jgi:hypothetical protein